MGLWALRWWPKCHGLEEEIEQSGDMPSGESFRRLYERWAMLEEKVAELNGDTDGVIEVPKEEYTRLTGVLTKAQFDDSLMSMVLSWDCEPLARVFGRFSSLAQQLSGKLGKGDLGICVDDGNVRVDPDVWGGLWSEYVHIVRNAVDHGLETPEERKQNGKVEPPSLSFRARGEWRHADCECKDNGRGILWDKVRERARAKGLAPPH